MPWLRALDDKIERGRAKFPRSRFMLFALVEEVGELVKAMLANNPVSVREEALQVAAIAIRIAEEGDATMDAYGSSRVASVLVGLGEYVRHALQHPRAPLTGAALSALCALKRHAELLIGAGGDKIIATADEEAAQP